MLTITAFYASLLAVLFLLLSVRVIGWPWRQRAQWNFAEYVPFALLLMALAESLGPPHVLTHLIGLTLLAGRALHAYALSQTPHNLSCRSWGATLTFAATGIAAMICFSLSALYLLV
ncbi:MAG: MAPEG family protein [Hyphomicrobium sp.]